MLLIGLMLNSFVLTLGLAILDPETKVSPDSIIRHVLAHPPFPLDYRLMWQLVCLSWKLRTFLFELCKVYLIFFRWVLSARHILCSAYPAMCAVYPVVLAFNRFILAYFRVVLAAYRVLSAACRLNSAISRYAALVLVVAAVRALTQEVVQLACLFARLVFAGTTLSRKTYKVLLVCAASLVILSWPRIKSAVHYAIYALYEGLLAFVIFQAARLRTRAMSLGSAVTLLSLPSHLPRRAKAIVQEGRVQA
uniref:Transcription factor n=1 Tax=Ganoderma boninense TaxID=34458 RepID=A0A5K1JUA0_9APHY|nr:Transcription factor [Ganoderma boninense]